MPPSIRAELGQRRPFRSVRQKGVVALLRTAGMIARTFEQVVQAEQISFAQYNVLRILRGAGRDGLPTMEIRARLIDPAAGITRLVSKLEAAGYLTRARTAGYRREVRCHISSRGLALLRRLDRAVDRADEAALAPLGAADVRRLIALLDRVRARPGGPGPA